MDIEHLIESHHRRLVGWFRARVGDRDVAEDLAQSTWIELMQRADTFDPELGSFFTWTTTRADLLLRRWRADRYRKRMQPTAEIEDAVEMRDAAENDAPTAEDFLDTRSAAAVFPEMLRQTASCRRLPHEIVAFGFVKLLSWKPRRFVDELAKLTVGQAADQLALEYAQEVPRAGIESCFEPLHNRMELPLGECGVDPRALKNYENHKARIVRSIRIEELLPEEGSAEAAVTRWWAAVARVLASELLRLESGPIAEWVDRQVSAGGRAT